VAAVDKTRETLIRHVWPQLVGRKWHWAGEVLDGSGRRVPIPSQAPGLERVTRVSLHLKPFTPEGFQRLSELLQGDIRKVKGE